MGFVIGIFLDTNIGDNIDHAIEGSGVVAHEMVGWKVNIWVTHRGI